MYCATNSQASFGPFYRIEQLLLTTLPHGRGRYTTPDGLPAIVTDDNIELLFDIQADVDALTAQTKVPHELRHGYSVPVLIRGTALHICRMDAPCHAYSFGSSCSCTCRMAAM